MRIACVFKVQRAVRIGQPGGKGPFLRYRVPGSPDTFFRMSFCMYSSPMRRFSSAGDSPGGGGLSRGGADVPLPEGLLKTASAALELNCSRQRCSTDFATLYLVQTAVKVVSRCMLSSTIFNFCSGVNTLGLVDDIDDVDDLVSIYSFREVGHSGWRT